MNDTTDEIDQAKSTTFHGNDVAATGDSTTTTSDTQSSDVEEKNVKKLNETTNSDGNSSKSKGWVQFEDDDDKKPSKDDKNSTMENVDLSDKVIEFSLM